MSPAGANSTATPTTSPPASPPTAATAIPCEPGRYRLIVARACPWANRAIIVRRLLGLEDVLSIGFCGPTHDERSWTFDLDPGGVDPVLKIPRLRDAYLARFPDYPKGITVPAIVDVPTGQVVTNDFAQMTLDLSTEWTAYHRDGAPAAVPEGTARRDRRGRPAHLHRGQQRRLPVRFRRLTGGLRQGLRPVVHRAGLAHRPARTSALSGRRHHHRGRRPAVHHAGPLRPRLPRPLQMQPVQTRRDAGAVGVRPRPVPDARIRRHHRLRADQAALLHRAQRHQPDAHRAQGARPVQLAHPTWSGSVGRQAVW